MEEETTGQSKLFVILAVSLVGLLVLGLLGIGGVFVIRQNLQEQAALAKPSSTIVVNLPQPTATPRPTNTAVVPTPVNTPVSSASVAKNDSGEEAAVGTKSDQTESEDEDKEVGLPLPKPAASRTPVAGASKAATPGEVPNTGLGALEAVLIAVGFGTVLIVARRMRLSS